MAGYGTVEITAMDKYQNNDEVQDIGIPLNDEQNLENNDLDTGLTRRSLWSFYTSHALFMWNNRSYGFASVLFTASVYPHTLLAASIRGLSCHLASLIFSPAVGRWCSTCQSRLRPVQACIIVQRLSIVDAAICWLLLFPRAGASVVDPELKMLVFGLLMILGMIERLSAVGNLVVVEREWLPLMARSREHEVGEEESLLLPTSRSHSPQLHILNATTKRIDLITKLVAPVAVSAIQLRSSSLTVTASVLALTQAVSLAFELYLTQSVYRSTPAFQAPKSSLEVDRTLKSSGRMSPITAIVGPIRRWLHSFQAYYTSSTFLPSLAYSLEPFSVLTLAGSMSSYLLIAHFPLSQITAARTASTIVEISSTVLTPLLVTIFGRKSSKRPDRATERADPLATVGLLGLGWQVLCLVPATAVLMLVPRLQNASSGTSSLPTLTLVLFASLAISRLGPYAFSLVEQQIVQLHITEHDRLEFSAVETALIDLSELCRWLVLGISGSPSHFRWVAVTSFASVALSFVLFLRWTRTRRS
ncbi:Solute carrier family 40 member 1 [Pseudocercospora fuligena]|uniref:Solute carrier family 40 member n=1 Tax=Pseudocercospora fuligena TaxID=685502 RepID=A0A8H6RNV1_9PEZI|nr:Solute carrier family 40 member 1 [Pseudocercospora fuligena]